MGKLLTGMAIVLGLGYSSHELWLSLAADDLDYAAIREESRQIEERVRARRDFIEVRDDTMRALGRGKITLPAACAQIANASKMMYPKYVQLIIDLTPGNSAEEKVARNVACHFSYLAEMEPGFAGAVSGVERQLAEMLSSSEDR